MALSRFPSDYLTTLSLKQTTRLDPEDVADITLTLDDLWPLTALNLTLISIDLNLTIELRDSSLVEFVSSCQQLSILIVNETFGWRAPGITPAGLAQILQTCPSLSNLCIALDTRGYTFPGQIQTGYAAANAGSLSTLKINVADSVIHTEGILSLAGFFADQMLGRGGRIFLGSWNMRHLDPESRIYKKRWENVETLTDQVVLEPRRVDCSPVVSR